MENHSEGVRHRKPPTAPPPNGPIDTPDASRDKPSDQVTWGKTASGNVFRVPETHSFLHTLLTTTHCSSLTRLTLFSLLAQPLLFYLLRNHHTTRSLFFLLYFAFWRGCYDWGFAWVLRKQSEKKWVVKLLRNWGWLDVDSEQGGQEGRAWARWWKRELEMKMNEGYAWGAVPQEFNAWLMFRQLVDVVLLNDFVSYTCFAWSNLHIPSNHSIPMHILRWTLGLSLILFNLWVKIDAHRVVKDYAWYWGDAFWMMVMQHDLVFDGVYEIAPHPMYSVGYAGYYGLSLVVGSYTVLFVSIAAHAAQFAFLLWFENPHIERTYGGGKKPLASRVPVNWQDEVVQKELDKTPGETGAPTPSATEGETETEPELAEVSPGSSPNKTGVKIARARADSGFSESSILTASSPTAMPRELKQPVSVIGSGAATPAPAGKSRKSFSKRNKMTMHDLTHRFFRKPVVLFSNLDLFRATDFALVLLVTYSIITLIPPLSPSLALLAHFLHALFWRLFHSLGLGLLLRAQSKDKWMVRHYLKHYHYPSDEGVVKRATEEAFGNWQVGYNISLVMTYVSFAGLAWKTYHLPSDWTVSGTLLKHILGLSLIALHIWSALSSYQVLSSYGWFYSDFFLYSSYLPSDLAYTGIYRFLNNPERSMGGAAFLGCWLMGGSWLVGVVGVVSHLTHWWFLEFVEGPHMQKLYGPRLRKDGGLTKTLKSTLPNSSAVRQAVSKHPRVSRVVSEMERGIERVEERVRGGVEEFLEQARPMLDGVVDDARGLLQQSRERMIITRVATPKDLTSYDKSSYSIQISTSSSSPTPHPAFHVGQPIPISWTAPSNHSSKDWIGIYRLGSCKSEVVTKISSVGKWVGVYEEEWEGNEHVMPESEGQKADAGMVVLKGQQLPWQPGQYEIRYHHDGKHNVMSRLAPIELYVDKPRAARPSEPASPRRSSASPKSVKKGQVEKEVGVKEVRETMMKLVCLALEGEEGLVPKAAKGKAVLRLAAVPTVPPQVSSDEANNKTALAYTVKPNQGEDEFEAHADTDAEAEGDGPLLVSGLAGGRKKVGRAGKANKEKGEDDGAVDDLASADNPHAAHLASLANRTSVRQPSILDLADADVNRDPGIDPSVDPNPDSDTGHETDTDPEADDFTIMTETQAKRIASLAKYAFGVELDADVVVAEANVGALARRVVGAWSLAAV
ncbi:hypothetical protein IAR50_005316 [Cryptococcus sp. DSM 104548]